MSNFKNLIEAIVSLDEGQVERLLSQFMKTEPSVAEAMVIVAGCQDSMKIVCKKYELGEYFINDMILAGELHGEVMKQVNAVIQSNNSRKYGKILLGCVSGEFHDIGKNLFGSMALAFGFEVIDLGVDVSAEVFIEMAMDEAPDIIAISGMLNTAIDTMKQTVDAIKMAGIKAKIIVGGTPVTD